MHWSALSITTFSVLWNSSVPSWFAVSAQRMHELSMSCERGSGCLTLSGGRVAVLYDPQADESQAGRIRQAWLRRVIGWCFSCCGLFCVDHDSTRCIDDDGSRLFQRQPQRCGTKLKRPTRAPSESASVGWPQGSRQEPLLSGSVAIAPNFESLVEQMRVS